MILIHFQVTWTCTPDELEPDNWVNDVLEPLTLPFVHTSLNLCPRHIDVDTLKLYFQNPIKVTFYAKMLEQAEYTLFWTVTDDYNVYTINKVEDSDVYLSTVEIQGDITVQMSYTDPSDSNEAVPYEIAIALCNDTEVTKSGIEDCSLGFDWNTCECAKLTTGDDSTVGVTDGSTSSESSGDSTGTSSSSSSTSSTASSSTSSTEGVGELSGAVSLSEAAFLTFSAIVLSLVMM